MHEVVTERVIVNPLSVNHELCLRDSHIALIRLIDKHPFIEPEAMRRNYIIHILQVRPVNLDFIVIRGHLIIPVLLHIYESELFLLAAGLVVYDPAVLALLESLELLKSGFLVTYDYCSGFIHPSQGPVIGR